eukprot:TRINITY_DN7418_c0_g1_i1.p1 TRINITY_DN7418_c0_g1~~TRINITY_DN7418_c0_g1_i1.p1  ORF type:complete len:241 (-),score=12.04 TRINITY_DN7418_c0_g1_i1:249-971(-)
MLSRHASGWLADSPVARYICSSLVGALIGFIISFIVNCTLVEISINMIISVYFGIFFCLIAAVLGYRVYTGGHPKPFILSVFTCLVAISGLCCFFLETDWFMNMSSAIRIPLYSLLGVSLCFALLFTFIDILNYCTSGDYTCECCRQTKAVVETETQLYLVITCTVIMGLIFGFVFGLFQAADDLTANIQVTFMREWSICYPIGMILGAICTCLNQWLRETTKTHNYDPVLQDDTLDENY